ncbi:MAG TPA: ABC transporter substrate-binding protein [Candidatus Nanopelagicales bacterium]|nr:ABC transporter substrate-binding protein [Candidatus Nanopelagicales bacterium]
MQQEKEEQVHISRMLKTTATGFVVVMLAAACGSSSGSTSSSGGGTARPAPPAGTMATSVGAGEGELNLITWPDYADDGTNGTPDTTGPFTKATGCQVNVKVGNTSDEMVTLMKTGQYDGVSASGDATLRLIYGGDVAPVNTALVPNYTTVAEFLKNKQWNSVNGQMYGIPHGWGANVLAYNLAAVKPAPTSWSVVFDANSPYKGKITAYDSPIYIADAALYLMKTKPDLKITNPYALDQTQFQAAVDLLKQQRTMISSYWASYTDEVKSFDAGAAVVGTAWQVNVNTMKAGTVGSLVPSEGATGWSDTWMIATKAAHPNCMYKWLDYIISPEANAGVAAYFGEAPAQTKACDISADMKAHCETYHALDPAYADSISYWTTPTKNCLDGRGDICVDYSAWVQAWTEIKG